MKLSAETLDVLKNFANINSGLKVKAGSEIETISNQRTLFASATVAEDFPVDFCIYDLNKFLAKHALYGDCDIKFEKEYARFVSSDGRRSDVYRYCSPNLITAVQEDKKIKPIKGDYTFQLSNEDLKWQIKSANISSAPFLMFKSDGETVKVLSVDIENDASDTSETIICEGDGSIFKIVVRVEYFKIIDGDYTVDVAKGGIMRITHKNMKLSYYVAVESKHSKFE